MSDKVCICPADDPDSPKCVCGEFVEDPEPHPWSLGSEDGEQADWLETALNHEIIYNHGARDGRGAWHVFDPKTGLWLPDDKKDVQERVDQLNVERLTRMILTQRSSKSRDALEKVYRRLRERPRIESALGMLSTRGPYKTDGGIFDRVPYLLGTSNGAVDLRTAHFMQGAVLRDKYISRATAVEWPKNEEHALRSAERFVEFLTDIMGEDEELVHYILRVLGYVLFGQTLEERFWLLIGPGRNGKGTLVRLLHKLLGSYSFFVPSSMYIRDPRHGDVGSDKGRPDILALKGARFAPTSEPVKGAFNDEMVKAHTGRDQISVRALYSNVMQSWEPSHKLFFLAQDAPSVDDVGPSMSARARVIRFEQSYVGKEDPGLGDRLYRAGSGILVMLAREAAEYWKGLGLEPDDTDAAYGMSVGTGLIEPQKITDWSRAYMDSNDAIGRFVTEACRTAVDLHGRAKLLFDAYADWHVKTEQEGEHMTHTQFGTELVKKGFRRDRDNRGLYYVGIEPKGAIALASDESV